MNNLRSSFSSERCIKEIADLKQQKYKKVNKSVVSLTSVEPSTIIEYVRSGINEILNYDSRIVRVIGGFLVKTSDITIM